MKRHDKLIAKFIEKTPLHCIYIAGSIARKPVKVHVDRLTTEPREGNKFIYWRRFWVGSEASAKQILSRFAATSWTERAWPAYWYNMGVDEAESRLREIAAQLDTSLTDNARVVARASDVVERYDRAIFAMMRSGEMKALNRAYKAHRASVTQDGSRSPCYEDWRDDRLTDVFSAIAARAFCAIPQVIETPQKKDSAPPQMALK